VHDVGNLSNLSLLHDKMHPFISLGDRIVLDSWQVMITLGVLGGSLVSFIVLKGEIGRARAWIVVGLMVAVALFGAHLAHWLLHPDLYHWEHHRILIFWRDGHALFGALALCALILLVVSRIIPAIPFWPSADAFALGAPLGLFFARIGCYMKGCCWGIPIQEGHPFYGLSVKLLRNQFLVLHPVQLYSAAAAIAIFLTLLAVRRRQKTPGLQAVLFVLLYASARFFLEFFRGDTQALFVGLTLSQGICVLFFLIGIFLLSILLRHSRRLTEEV
jgi:phosphatidylglycerol:prolipoprotein diacylglycerol transferase